MSFTPKIGEAKDFEYTIFRVRKIENYLLDDRDCLCIRFDAKHGPKKRRMDLRRKLFEPMIIVSKIMQYGETRVNAQTLEVLSTSHATHSLQQCPYLEFDNHSSGLRSRTYRFKKDKLDELGIEPDPDGPGYRFKGEPEYYTIPGEYMDARAEMYQRRAEKMGWTQQLDTSGGTFFGKAALQFMQSIELPSPEDLKDEDFETPEKAEHARRTLRAIQKKGLSPIVVRRHGRVYSQITNLAKQVRRRIKINGEATAEVDVHAMFTALEVAEMPEGDEKELAKKLLSKGNIYEDLFGEAYERTKSERSKGVKVEVQRQVYFSASEKSEHNPLREALRAKLPTLERMIRLNRYKKGRRQYATSLQARESAVMIDKVWAEIGGIAGALHDGMQVATSMAEQVRSKIIEVLHDTLGFHPSVKIKRFGLDGQELPGVSEASLGAV